MTRLYRNAALVLITLAAVALIFACDGLPPICGPGEKWCDGKCVPSEQTCEKPEPTCPAECPPGTRCTDPAKGCVEIPAPGPVCVEGKEDCDCYVKPPGEDWTLMTCWGDKVCINKVCRQPPNPEPKCQEGQNCSCWVKDSDITGEWVWMSCSAPKTCQNFVCKLPVEPPPGGGGCPYPTPTAREAAAQGKNPTINVQREGVMQITATPLADFGTAYYCQIGWTAACNEKRVRGPVAPEGDPNRIPCENHFMEQPCPTFSQAQCTGEGIQCPITFDPYFVIGGVNQNHPQNVAAGCREANWIKVGGQVVKGEFWRATAHGKGTIKACNADESVCGVSSFEINQ